MSARPAGLLARSPIWVLVGYSAAAAFGTYFCMYAFRKPFTAVLFTGQQYMGTAVELKTACVLAQVVGYCLSKFVGAKWCAEVRASRRGLLLVGLVLFAEGALVLFAVLPPDLKPAAMFLNGLPLGMVWGVCVRYLEGRRATEVMVAGMSCSFIVAAAATRDIGRDVVMAEWGVPEVSMPAATGLLFLLPFVFGVVLMELIPPPSAADVAARSERTPMGPAERRAFLKHYGVGFGLLLAAYFLLTAFRDFRDHYGVELLTVLGLSSQKGVFSNTEKWAMLGVIAATAGLTRFRSHRAAVAAVYAVIAAGFAVIGLATAAYLNGLTGGYWWVALTGVGLYLAYIPFGAALFERMTAGGRVAGTAAFAIQLADGVGYTGSVVVQLLRDLAFGRFDRLQYALVLGVVVSAAGVLLMAASGLLCVRRVGR